MAEKEEEFGTLAKQTSSSAPPPATEPSSASSPATPSGACKVMSKMAIYEQIAAQAKAKTKGGSSFTPPPAALAAAALATASARMASDSPVPSSKQPAAPPPTPNLTTTDTRDGGLAVRANAQRIADLERQLEAKEMEIESAKQKATAYVQVWRPLSSLRYLLYLNPCDAERLMLDTLANGVAVDTPLRWPSVPPCPGPHPVACFTT